MTARKYQKGKQICSVSDFENSSCEYFKVMFGKADKTMHRSFLIGWQYRTLKKFIDNGWVFEAERITDGRRVLVFYIRR